jgi:hypothetical protein
MPPGEALPMAETIPVEGMSLKELKEAARNLLALAPDSALAGLVEERIAVLEDRCGSLDRSIGPP